jgi:hypothetical protein
VPVSHITFPLLGLLNLLVGWPLARRRVPPNRWYGVRIRATLTDPAVWYEANAVCGDGFVRHGIVLLTVALVLLLLPALPELGYALICTAVLAVGTLRTIARSVRLAGRLRREGPTSPAARS